MSATLTDEALFNIETSIKKNKFYYDGVLDDPAFIPFRPQIMALRAKLFNNIKKQNENEVANLYSQFKLKQLFELNKYKELPYHTKNMIEDVNSDMNLIDLRTKKNTYIDYVDNIELIRDMNKRLEIIKNSLTDFKKICESSLSDLKLKFEYAKRDVTTSKKNRLMDEINASLLFLLTVPGICLPVMYFIDPDFFKTDSLAVFGIFSLSLAVLIVCINFGDSDYKDNSKDVGWLSFISIFFSVLLVNFIISSVIIAVFVIAISIIGIFSESLESLLGDIVLFITLVIPPILSLKLLYVNLHVSRKEKEAQDNCKNLNKQISDMEFLLKEVSKNIY